MNILGMKLINGKKAGEFESFAMNDVIKIDSYNSGGHCVPRYHTRSGMYIGISTLAECKKVFGFVQLDNGTLADASQISHITDNGWSVVAHFYNSSLTANIARSKKNMIEQLIQQRGMSEA